MYHKQEVFLTLAMVAPMVANFFSKTVSKQFFASEYLMVIYQIVFTNQFGSSPHTVARLVICDPSIRSVKNFRAVSNRRVSVQAALLSYSLSGNTSQFLASV